MLALLTALMLPSWSAALQPSRGGEAEPPGRFLPGSDVGVSPHATWQDGPDGPQLKLVGVAGARLVVEEALVLRVTRDASRLEVHAAADGVDRIGEFALQFRRAGVDAGTLRLAGTAPLLDLGAVKQGDAFEIGVALSIPPEAAEMGRIFVRFWVTASPVQSDA